VAVVKNRRGRICLQFRLEMRVLDEQLDPDSMRFIPGTREPVAHMEQSAM
jgi:hypothetical protein